jgi:RHS repeat-associated protein
MCPSVAVLAGGGDGGGGSGDAAGGGGGKVGAGTASGGTNAQDDARDAAKGAPDYKKYPECGYASHPVDVITGRAFTHPITDLSLPGPLRLEFQRMYSSKMAERDVGLGYGWGHTFGWEVEVGRRSILVWNEQGIAVEFPMIAVGNDVIGPWGWVLRRESWGFAVDADDGLWHLFSAPDESGKRYKLTALEDRNKNRIALTYEDGRLVEATDSAGRLIRFTATKEGRIEAVKVQNAVAQGQWVAFASYAYDSAGHLASVTDADGFSSHYEYDEDHRLTLDVDRTGLTFHFVYGAKGRCVESWGDYPGRRDPSLSEEVPKVLADGVTRAKGIHHCKFQYYPDGYSEVADSLQVRRFFGTKHGTVSKRVDGGDVMTATYRDDGHILSRVDAVGAITKFERDRRGRVTRVVDPLGRTTELKRDANGLPVEVIDPAEGVTRLERDLRGNVLISIDAAKGTNAYAYDERGLLLSDVSATGARRAYVYDAQGNLVLVTTPNGGQWQFKYDALGRLISQIDPLGAETRRSYSPRGDVVMDRDSLGGVTRYSYDGEGHLTQVVDPKGQTMALTWGGYHRICLRRSAGDGEARFSYDREGNLVSLRNERGDEHRFEHDSKGRLIAETTFDGRTLRYGYDAAGRVVRYSSGANEDVKITYDLAGQLLVRELPDDSTEEFHYDARGDVVGAKSRAGEFLFERDAIGRIVREVQRVGGEEHWVVVEYDPSGQRTQRRTSLGHVEAVTRGSMGERTRTVLDTEHTVLHRTDVRGRETGRELPGGGWIQSTYDPLGRASRRSAGGDAPGVSVGPGQPEWIGALTDRATIDTVYRYDWDGSLVESQDRGRGVTEYRYDPLGQLLARLPEKAQAELFRYDATGNVHESAAAGESREYARGDRLVRKGNTDYIWDANGRLLEKREKHPESGVDRSFRYTWDGAGRLCAAEGLDGTLVEFTYDPFARRLQKRVSRAGLSRRDRVPVSLTRFVWDRDVLVHEITTRAQEEGDPIVEERTYCFGDGSFEPVAHREARRDDVGDEHAAWFHYVNDPAGTPERLVAADGRVACELKRQAFGATEIVDAGATTPLRLQGQYEDEETGLRYNRNRYYDPDTGRFTSADPTGLNGGLNAFAFGRNAISFIDPLGLQFVVSPARRVHILEGDPPGTGHGPAVPNNPNRQPGRQGEFPATWTDDQAIAAVERVANSPNSTWRQSTGPGCQTAPLTTGGPDPNAPQLNNKGRPVRFEVTGRDHGQDIAVIVEPHGGGGIITGHTQ